MSAVINRATWETYKVPAGTLGCVLAELHKIHVQRKKDPIDHKWLAQILKVHERFGNKRDIANGRIEGLFKGHLSANPKHTKVTLDPSCFSGDVSAAIATGIERGAAKAQAYLEYELGTLPERARRRKRDHAPPLADLSQIPGVTRPRAKKRPVAVR